MPPRAAAYLAIASAMTLCGCTCVENALLGPPEKVEPPAEALPELFAPLRWDTPEEQLPRLVPGTRLEDGPWFGEPFWRWYRSRWVVLEIPRFGRADVEVQYVRPARGDGPPTISAVTARRGDPRLDCSSGAKPPRRGEEPPASLSEAFAKVRGAIEARYGRAAPAAEESPTWRELSWPRDGFTLALRLRTDPGCDARVEAEGDDVWLLELAAETPRAF